MAGSFRSPSKVARRLRLTPLAARKLKTWPTFMYHYALGIVPADAYRFRNGACLKIGRGIDHVPIIEIFLREDYGTIPDDAVILDLGASFGVFSVYAATTARNARLYAFEPMPDLFQLMQLNIGLNGLGDVVQCFDLAVSAADGDRELFVVGTDLYFPTLIPPPHRESATSRRVHCTTLAAIMDANALGHVDLLKMDVEGAEYETLYGTPSTYFERIREIRMEYHHLDSDTRNVHNLKRFLAAQRYRITREQPTTPTNGNLWAERHD